MRVLSPPVLLYLSYTPISTSPACVEFSLLPSGMKTVVECFAGKTVMISAALSTYVSHTTPSSFFETSRTDTVGKKSLPDRIGTSTIVWFIAIWGYSA